jgi:anti-sigma-K factor RskA
VNVEEFAELSAGHALSALSPEDERTFREALSAHPEWAAIADRDAATAGRLGESVATVEPPAGIRAALLARIGGAAGTVADDKAEIDGPVAVPPPVPSIHPAAAAADFSARAEDPAADVVEEPTPAAIPEVGPAPTERPTGLVEPLLQPVTAEDRPHPAGPPPSTEAIQTVARRNWTRGLLALAASFVLLIALGTTAVVIGDRLREPASVVALDQIEAAADAQAATVEVEGGGTATAHWAPSLGKAVLVTDGVDDPGSGKTYELWFVRGDGAVSAGLFEPDDTGSATAVMKGSMQSGDTIAVTVEDRGGSPTGAPTTEPIIAIPTA